MHTCYDKIRVMKMAEFCLQCWNEINGTNAPPDRYILSKELDLCEGCGKWTNVIVAQRKFWTLRMLFRRKKKTP